MQLGTVVARNLDVVSNITCFVHVYWLTYVFVYNDLVARLRSCVNQLNAIWSILNWILVSLLGIVHCILMSICACPRLIY